jgi:glycosyltransferase involved in cell wall biosynthesis
MMERALSKGGVTVETVTTDEDGPRRHNGRSCGVAIAENGVTRRYFRNWSNFYKVSPGLAWWLLRNVHRFDVVHIHALFSFSSVAAACAARWAGVPYVIRPLGTLARYGMTQNRPWLKRLSLAWLDGPALRAAAAVHFTSHREHIEAVECGIAMHSVICPLGIEADTDAGSLLANETFRGLQGASYLLFLARLHPVKNVEGLLRGFTQCVLHWPNIKLLVAGDGDPGYVVGLKRLADELQLSDHVVWAGHIDGELKAAAFAGATAFVLPSFSENFGIAAAEALMAGLPCVLGEGVAIAREVAEAGAGFSVAPEPGAIAIALNKLLGDPNACVTMSARAAALARDKYSAEAMSANLVRLYSEIVKR